MHIRKRILKSCEILVNEAHKIKSTKNHFFIRINTILNTSIVVKNPSGPEVNAIDDAPQDEASNGPFFGISRIAKIELDNQQLVLGQIKLVRNNSLANFVTSGNNNTFQEKTKFKPK